MAWVVNAYTIFFAGFLLLSGRLVDVVGRRRVLLVGLAVFSLASLVGGLAPAGWVLVGARALQGLAAAGLSAASLAVVLGCFAEGEPRNRALTIWGAAAAAGGAVGTVLGGVLTAAFTWRATLLINVPVGAVLAVLCMRALPVDRPTGRRPLDLLGGITVTLGVAAVTFAIVAGEQAGWSAPSTLAALGCGIVLLGVFVANEAVLSADPMLPLALLRERSLVVGNVLMALVGGISTAMWFFLSLHLQNVAGYGPLRAGLAITPFALLIVALTPVVPVLMRRLGRRRLVAGSALLAAVGFTWWSVAAGVGDSYLVDVLPAGLLAAAGSSGLVAAPVVAIATDAAPACWSGSVSGLTTTTRMLGGALALAVLAAAATARITAHAGPGAASPGQLSAGYNLAFALSAGLAVVMAALAILALPSTRRAPAGMP